MELVQELFEKTSIAPHAIYLDNAPLRSYENTATYDQIRTIILMADKDMWPDDLQLRSGCVIEGTNFFTQACFSDIYNTVDYCFQVGRRRRASLVKVCHLGEADLCDSLFERNDRVVTPEGELLEAQYLATYKDGVWHILNEKDRLTRLDCESKGVFERSSHVSL